MRNGIIYAVRLLVGAIVLILGVLGYICYEKTLVAWWMPVAAAAAVTVSTAPLMRDRWRWLAGQDRTYNLLCHLYVTGVTCYFLLLWGNCAAADVSSTHSEEVAVIDKEHVTRNTGYRSGRRYRRSNRTTHSYYLTVRLTDGTVKELSVPLRVYNRSRRDMTMTINIRSGLLGFRVVEFP